ncbi:MAG: C39 family peptidase [Candidatus Dormibacteraeota bacterium]|nr:C39 family peptidase [Candidatus Dormibacteraeota bacterium]
MPAPIVDLRYARAHTRRRRWAGHRAAVAAILVVAIAALAYGGYRGGRFLLHRAHAQGTASSHALNRAQLGNLTSVDSNLGDDRSLQHERAGAVPEAVTPPPAPAGAILKAPYTVQAPFGNWKFHQESCEEAALLMYHDFLEGDQHPDIPPAEADQALRAIKAWEVQNWGAEVDLSIDRTGELAQQYYSYKYQVIAVTPDSVRQAVAAGHPVVVPVMTHSLQNPHYGPMSVYHEVLIKGYNADGVVANDAGVQEGKDWFYSWPILLSAIDAQTPRMHQGRVGLILTK